MAQSHILTNYQQFKAKIAEGNHIPNYYELLIIHKDALITDAYQNKNYIVAKQLGMSAPKLSSILSILKALQHREISAALNKGITYDC